MNFSALPAQHDVYALLQVMEDDFYPTPAYNRSNRSAFAALIAEMNAADPEWDLLYNQRFHDFDFFEFVPADQLGKLVGGSSKGGGKGSSGKGSSGKGSSGKGSSGKGSSGKGSSGTGDSPETSVARMNAICEHVHYTYHHPSTSTSTSTSTSASAPCLSPTAVAAPSASAASTDTASGGLCGALGLGQACARSITDWVREPAVFQVNVCVYM